MSLKEENPGTSVQDDLTPKTEVNTTGRRRMRHHSRWHLHRSQKSALIKGLVFILALVGLLVVWYLMVQPKP